MAERTITGVVTVVLTVGPDNTGSLHIARRAGFVQVGEEWDERTRKAVYAASAQRSRNEADLREAPQASIAERFGGGRPGNGRPRP